MKIAFAFTNFPSSGENSNVSRVTGLIDRGHDVSIFALAAQSNLKKVHEEVVEYGLPNRVKYHGKPSGFLSQLSTITRDIITAPAETVRRFHRALHKDLFPRHARIVIRGLPSRELDIQKVGLQSPIGSYFLQRTYERNHDFQIMHIFTGPTANKLLFLKKLYPQIKLVVTFVGYDFSKWIRMYGATCYVELFKNADLILTKSRYSRNCLLDLGAPADKVEIQMNGIDLERFPYKTRYIRNPHDLIHLITVARLVPKKSHRLLLDAFRKVASQHANLRLHIVGSGEQKRNIQQIITQDQVLKDQVILHGFLSQAEVIALLDQSHIFVLPSATDMEWADQEDTPTALLEAQAMGLPVISTFHAGIPEIVKNGETGMLVPERNEELLAQALAYLVDTPESWQELGKNGRHWVEQNFDLHKTLDDLEHHYHRVLGLCSHSQAEGIYSQN